MITVLVVIDESQFGYYGGKVAAPAFKKIAYDTLNYLNIPPQKNNYKLTASVKSETTG